MKTAAFPELGNNAATDRSIVDRPLPFRSLAAGIEVFSDNFRLRLSLCIDLYRRDRGAGRNKRVGREREASSSVKPLFHRASFCGLSTEQNSRELSGGATGGKYREYVEGVGNVMVWKHQSKSEQTRWLDRTPANAS